MSTTDPAHTRPTVRQYPTNEPTAYTEDGTGWMLFAAVMLAIIATFNFIDGVAAVSNSKFYVANAEFVFSNLNTWGWILIALSVIQAVVVTGIVLEWRGFRWGGVAIAGLNSIVQLLFMPAYPLWGLSLFALNVLVIYALVAYGAVDRS
jgi:magnesium-transporting ATPase (P-type)